MPKLIVSNQRTDEMIGDLGTLPPEYRRYVAGQAQRMIWLAGPGDVFVLPVELDEEFLSYVARLKGVDRSSWTVVVPPVGRLGEDVLSRDRLEDPGFVARLRAAVREHGVRTILPFHFDRVSVRLARTLGLDAHTPGFPFAAQSGTALLNSKATFRALAVGHGIPVPHGTVTDDRAEAEEFLWDALGAGRPVIAKQDFHVGGIGNEIVSPVPGVRPIGATGTEVVTDRAALAAHLDRRWASWTGPHRGRVVLEHYTPESPAIYSELRVEDDGVRLVGHGEMRMKPVINGLVVPAPSQRLAAFATFLDDSRRLSGTLRRIGYRGSLSVDAIVTPDERILVNEINGRVVGSAHIHRIGEELVGGNYPEERVLVEKRRVAFPDFRTTLDELVDAGLAYDAARRTGVVVTVHDNGRTGGFGGSCLIAPDDTAVRELEEEVDALFGGTHE
ncbi:peptide ligase PGM1-related protein [Streptomyces tropicalis]|uniref:Peptide ligase PGM1-related protein n=1 Tax=Streptomyces tropicalis TaxID=3034234 RepID=A0ABT6ABT2_9ACTN|nr:peptide ligase PGM1-related protein [Streptomyces tropicalis]MDF3302112.1 peptide ligase PGM1-related protein [Streptomyces tropicalis]